MTHENRLARDRFHRRVITERAGKPLIEASCPVAILTGILGALKAHESLLKKANILHRDISVENILLKEDESDGFLIDFDPAVDITWLAAPGAPKTDKRVFAAIGVLANEPHSFMHDLESFFWVLFWMCHHCTAPGEETRDMTDFKRWTLNPALEVAELKQCLVDDKSYFYGEISFSSTPYCRDLVPCIEELRNVVFPGGQRWATQDDGLYLRMTEVLEKARDAIRVADHGVPRCEDDCSDTWD